MSDETRLRIAIVGGGICGLSTGLVLQQQLADKIQTIDILSDKWSPNTTGDVSAGLIYPYLVGPETDAQLAKELLEDTVKYFDWLQQQSYGGLVGVSRINMYELFSDQKDFQEHSLPKEYHHLFTDHRRLSDEELKQFGGESSIGTTTTTYTVEVSLLLSHYMEEFQKQVLFCSNILINSK